MRQVSSWRARALVGVMLALASLAPATARADEASDKTRAKQLFEEGLRAVERGRPTEGCAKLRESLTLFTVPNTLFNVAKCDEGEGKIASALEHWQRGVALVSGNDPRFAVAKKRIATLEPRVPRLRIVIPTNVSTAVITLDATDLDVRALAKPLAVDPGKHTLIARVPDHEAWTRTFELAERERTEIVIQAGARSSRRERPDEPTGASGKRVAGFVVVGVGALGAAVAAITGGILLARDTDIEAHCDGLACDATGYELAQGQKPLLVGNGIGWGVGAAGFGVGTLLLILSRRPPSSSAAMVAPLVLEGGGGIGVMGRF